MKIFQHPYIYFVLLIVTTFLLFWLNSTDEPEVDRGIAKFTFELRDAQLIDGLDPLTHEPTQEFQATLVLENYSPKTLSFDLVIAKFYAGDSLVCISRQTASFGEMVYTAFYLPADTTFCLSPDSIGSILQFELPDNSSISFNIVSMLNFGSMSDKSVKISLYKADIMLIGRCFDIKDKENIINFERST